MSSTRPEPGWWHRHIEFYRANAAVAFQRSLQYRGAQFLGMFALMTEPVVYLVVWATVADQQPDGRIGGLTVGQVSAYYVVWTLVRNLTAGRPPAVWEQRLRDGSLADWMLRPIHPLHDDMSAGLATNLPRVVVTIPLTIGLVIAFRPDWSVGPVMVAAASVSIVAAYVLRVLIFSTIGMVGFWATRVDAAARVHLAAELLLSGRLVPIAVFPAWLATSAEWLPFRYTFGFPIELLTTPMSGTSVAAGLALQIGWTAVIGSAVVAIWRVAVRHFDSVGL